MDAIDPKAFGKVAVLYGGESSERDVSLVSGPLVCQGLRDAGVDAHLFDPKERPLSALKDEGFVRAFIALHGGYGENGQIQGALDFYGIRYTGPGVLGSALGMDKFRTKLIWQQLGIPTPPFDTVLRGEDYDTRAQQIVAKLGLPLFVKPATEGSSVAVIKVKAADNLPYALAQAAQHDPVVLVEKSIDGGGEYTACIAGSLPLPLIRIVPAGEFYDYHAKYVADDTQYLIPCGLSDADEQRLTALARRAFEVLACVGWGRADFMLDSDGNPYFLEVNTAPGMTDHSLPPKAARAVGISYSELLVNVLALTLKD
ncbi:MULTISPECIES: D-alanine--D-alanine ligase [Burkholderiaceae]|uniref:D-alanine--D-alanine ligase n=1 Tax=Burkholderiaceae TaxID=119060 RepID=UPI0009757A05|nr:MULTISPECIES: D-alanine--D-alanine ligase [Burkholderiaceae]MCF2132820.1 D-alanine--D-alanine ligase [Mycetohabitans sp. B3]MCG1038271.1 D-alanine--D-alanine ligase [Mycetohabitans sp. B7]